MKTIDKVIEYFAPTKALQRAAARTRLKILNAGYSDHGASQTKKSLLGFLGNSISADDDIVRNLDTLRQRSRSLYMGGSPIATGALKTISTNVVGAGLRLNPNIDYEFLGMTADEADAWEKRTLRDFDVWANTTACDAVRMNNFYAIQQLAFLSVLMSGDCFIALPQKQRPGELYSLKLQVVEADRVCNPADTTSSENILGGVELNNDKEICAYWIAKRHPLSVTWTLQDWKDRNQFVRVEAFGLKTGRPNILHLKVDERPDQRRGVPLLSPVIEAMKQIGRYTEAELMAAVVAGMFTVFIESVSPHEHLGPGAIPLEEQVDTSDMNSFELGNGTIMALKQGEKANAVNPGRPNTAFEGFVEAICKQVGTALEIPYELLMKRFDASYSAARASLLEAWKMFKMRREWMVNNFCQPVYEEWLTEAVLKGRVIAPGFFDDPVIKAAYCRAEWHGPSQGQIDPLKEVRSAILRVENGFSNRAKEAQELTGTDFDSNVLLLKREHVQLGEAGLIRLKGGEIIYDIHEMVDDYESNQ